MKSSLSPRPWLVVILAGVLALTACFADDTDDDDDDDGAETAAASTWSAIGGDSFGTRHAAIDDVNADNVTTLVEAWTYSTGEQSDGGEPAATEAFEATPIMIDGTLFVSTPRNRIIALDAGTGAEQWTYDPGIDLDVDYSNQLVSRGVSTWLDSEASEGEPCRRRILAGTNDGRLIALDAVTGRPCVDFGADGEIVLTDGIGDWQPGEYQITSPPAVIGQLVVVGSAIADYRRAVMPSGVVRAFDARNGRMVWSWEPASGAAAEATAGAPTAPGEPAEQPFGAANAWAPISADPGRDLVFVPTSAPSPDYFGGLRPGADSYANSIVALRASTGDVVWDFQVVHHDVWDYDVPAQPALITVEHDGENVDAVAVVTKMGFVFVFDRETGEPLFPVEEMPVPTDGVAGETLSPTQPRPSAPEPLVDQELRAEDVFGLTDADEQACREQVEALRNDGLFTPPTTGGTLQYPAYLGGMNWSGMSFDPERQLLITSTNNLPAALRLFPRDQVDEATIAEWERDLEAQQVEIGQQAGTPYIVRREFLLSPSGLPCAPPPWGELVAVDLRDGDVAWRVPMGATPELALIPGSKDWGSLNLGGAITTSGGLVFIAASRDDFLRAFDTDTGELLWEGQIPAGGQATPMTYEIDGKQYVVISAGGHGRLGTTPGDKVVAFALP